MSTEEMQARADEARPLIELGFEVKDCDGGCDACCSGTSGGGTCDSCQFVEGKD